VERAYDAVVVGSGFGGGIAACRLAEAGKRVCVLERGRRFAPTDFIEEPNDAPKLLWHPRFNTDGLFDVRLMKDVTVITAAGVGGGSLVYANVQLKAPPAVFDQGWPAAIDADELDPWYALTEKALMPELTPDDPPIPKALTFEAAGRRAGKDPNRLPIAVYFGEKPRAHPFSGVEQNPCENLGRCDIGCPVNARNTVDITYVARAEAHGAQVYPLHMAETIEPPDRDGGNWRVSYSRLGDGDDGSVEAPTLVLAAGTIGSPRLLLTNRKRLPNLSPALGTKFSGNGDALGLAFDPQAEDVKGAENDFGPVMTSKLDYPERRAILANGGLPRGYEAILEVARGVNLWRRWLLKLRRVFVHVGMTDQQMHPRELKLHRPREPDRDALIFLMMGRDAADGRMRLTPIFKRFDIRWDKAGSEKLFGDLEKSAHELADAAKADLFYALEGGPVSTFATVHPLGGCPMADDPELGVVDDAGRVHNYSGLYVLDGSIVPTALGVNPSKTIAALAERGVARLVAEL
jgi:cholesterol oxidase